MVRSLSLLLSSALLPALALAQHEAAPGEPTARTIPVRGTNTLLKLWEDGGRHASVSRDGGQTWRELQTPETVLNLRFARFDPMLHGEPSIPAGLAARSDSELHIVQFETPIIEEFKHDLKVLGAQRYQPLPHQGFLVRTYSVAATCAAVARSLRTRKPWCGSGG